MSTPILITDDTLFMRVSLKNILTANGFPDVHEASNGQEAVAMYTILEPSVVLMDITMPVMDGITATRNIVQLYPNAKIIICSAMGQKNMVVEAMRAGAKDFILKPFQTDRVIESVEKWAAAA